MTRADDVRRLADRLGIVPSYRDMMGTIRETSVEAQEALAASLGFPCDGLTGPRERLYAIPIVQWLMRPPKDAARVRIPGGREQGLDDLRALDIRYIVRSHRHRTVVEEAFLGLEEVYVGKGVKVFRVPRD